VKQVAREALAEIEGSLPRALAGDRRQVHLYVAAYRRLADQVLGAVGEARPDLILFDERNRAVAVVEFKGPGGRPAETPWFRAALEQSAMSAPFSDWVGQMGVGKGTGVAFVALVRETLPGVEPLHPGPKRRLPDWDLDIPDVLRFYRAVVDELEQAEMPLERVQAALGLSRTEFAALFGVRRQALDYWEATGVPAERQEKLATVEEIADLLVAKLKDERIPGVVRRSSSAYGGRSALDAIAEGDQELVLAELRDAFDWAAAA
jgi:DNA-binding XRE family transcriptional regulator